MNGRSWSRNLKELRLKAKIALSEQSRYLRTNNSAWELLFPEATCHAISLVLNLKLPASIRPQHLEKCLPWHHQGFPFAIYSCLSQICWREAFFQLCANRSASYKARSPSDLETQRRPFHGASLRGLALALHHLGLGAPVYGKWYWKFSMRL